MRLETNKNVSLIASAETSSQSAPWKKGDGRHIEGGVLLIIYPVCSVDVILAKVLQS